MVITKQEIIKSENVESVKPENKEKIKPANSDPVFNEALEAIRLMNKKRLESIMSTTVKFAGQTYNIERNTTQKDVKKLES